MSKLLFFDIDGTLTGKSKVVTAKNKEAIALTRKKGNKAFVCTGRAPTSITKEIKDIEFDGFICSAGGLINIDGKYIFENKINNHLLSYVMTLFINNNIIFSLETKESIYETNGVRSFFENRIKKRYSNNLELERFFMLRRQGEDRKPINEFDINKVGVTKIVFISKDKESFKPCIPFIDKYFNIVYFSKPEDSYINGEIIIKNCTKADGILKVVDYYDGKMNDTIAFGDSMNDYEMIKEANIGVVYKGAIDTLKKEADYFFEDPDDDGIYKIMKELDLI